MDRLDALAVFVTVAEHESFSEAARQLNRSAAAVTRAVAALEEQLQVRLLNRTTRAVSLTEAGARTLETARRLLAGMDELAAVTEQSSAPRGAISVTAPTMFGRLHVLPLVQSFLLKHPEVSIRLMLLDRVVSLVDEGLDLGVRIGPLPDSSLRAIKLGDVRECILASPDYLTLRGRPQTPRELAQHDIIACTIMSPVPERWAFSGIGPVTLTPRLIVNTPEAAIQASVEGLGLTLAMSYQGAAHVAAGRLVTVLREYEPSADPVHIVHPAGRHLPARVRLLLDHLTEGLRAAIADVARIATE